MIIDVTNLEFETLNFQKSYDPTRKERGKSIYYNQNVQVTSVDKIDESNYEIKAMIRGNNDDYTVELHITGNMVKKCSCTCMDYENGNRCKHIWATCMEVIKPHYPSSETGRKKYLENLRREQQERINKIRKQKEEAQKRREYEIKYRKTLHAIAMYKNSSSQEEGYNDFELNIEDIYKNAKEKVENGSNLEQNLANEVKLEPKIEFRNNGGLNIEFKIGQTTMYVLKDLTQLYDAYIEKKTIHYGKKLTFIPMLENFKTEVDKKLFEFIIQYAEMLKYSEDTRKTSYYYPGISTKTLSIFEKKLDQFFDIVKNKEITFFSYSSGETTYTYIDEPLEIKLGLREEADDYILTANLKDFYCISSNKKMYIFKNDKIYSISKKENEELIRILNLLEDSDEMLIPKDKLKEFSTFVLPKINKYLNLNNLPQTNIKEAIVVNKLSNKMYLDLDDIGNIKLELKFCYQNFEFNILEQGYEKYIEENKIIRNIPEEKEVLTRIFIDGFEIAKGKSYFTLKNMDYMYAFLQNKIEGYMNDFEVLATEKFKNKKIKEPKISNIGIKLESNLLSLDLSNINIDIEEMKQILESYKVKKKYYKLKNGNFLSLDQDESLDFLSDLHTTFEINYKKLEEGIIELPVNRSIYLEKILEKNKTITVNRNEQFTKLINNVENKNFSDNIIIDEKFEKVLRNYQKTGYKWLKTLEDYHFGGILADDMGLGKTIQIIALLASSKKEKPSIVICPSSLVLNWEAEVNKWCEELKVLIINGTAKNRSELINKIQEHDLVITSYDLLKRDVEKYEDISFKYIIADEAQYIKNSLTKNAISLKLLNGETKFALTGTPIENSIAELWSIFDFIMPDYLYSYGKFKKKFEEPILKEDTEALKRLKTLINPFILRRIKKDVLTELPEKNTTIMKNEMTKEQEKIYMSYFAQTKKEISKELNVNGFEKSKFKILMLLTRLRQICCHPQLFIENYKGGSGKLEQCMGIIEDAIEAGHKILLFSSYTSMFEIIEKQLLEKGINYYKLTGGTKVDKRVEMVESFNKNDDVKVFLISLKAGGTGLNLTSADVVIHYDPWWNVSSENQATDRAYRIGQKNSVQVYKLITTNSIEEKINSLQEKKAKVSESLLSVQEKFVSKLSKEEIMDLFT